MNEFGRHDFKRRIAENQFWYNLYEGCDDQQQSDGGATLQSDRDAGEKVIIFTSIVNCNYNHYLSCLNTADPTTKSLLLCCLRHQSRCSVLRKSSKY